MRQYLYRLLLLPWLLLAAWGARAQAPTWQSAMGVSANGASSIGGNVGAVATNGAGDVFITGSYTGTATFGTTTLTSSSGSEDVYVAKWNTSVGTWAWAVSSTGDGSEIGFAIAVSGNNVYVGGAFSSTSGNAATISGSALTCATTDGGTDAFIAKYYDNGTTVISKGAFRGGGAGNDRFYGLAVNASTGTVYAGGTVGASGTVSGTALTTPGGTDLLLARYTDAGMNANTSLVEGGAIRAGGAGTDRGFGLTINAAGSLYLVGNIGSSGATIGSSVLTSAGSNDVVVAKATDTGGTLAFVAAARAGGAGSDIGFGIASSGTSVYVTGQYISTTATFGSTTLTNADNTGNTTDAFVACFVDGGSTLTATSALNIGSTGTDVGRGIAVSGGVVYATGNFSGTVTIGSTSLTAAGSQDVYAAKYTDTSGILAANGGLKGGGTGTGTNTGIGLGSGTDGGAAITIAANNSQAVVVGSIDNTTATTFGGTTLGAGPGGFIAKLTGLLAAPTVTTATPATITGTSAVLGGNVTADGGGTVTDRGVVYSVNSTNATPTIGGTGVTTNPNSTAGTGAFSEPSTGLTPNTTYAVAAYATNSVGTSYGSPLTFTTAALPAVTALAPPNGPVGTNVTITGTGFALGATVTFNGTTATTVTVNSATQIIAQVPAGATTGNVVVTTSAGSSNAAAANVFTVTVPTTVTSITTAVTSPTNSGSISYTVTFANSVMGLMVSNFSLSPTVTGASVSSVSGSGTTYTVVVSTGSGDGTLQLNLANSTGLSPSVSNVPFAGPAITIDKTRPSVAISSTAGVNNGTTATTPIPFTVTFSEAVTGFVAGDVTVSNGAITAGSFSGSGAAYTFNVTPSGSGSTVAVNTAANVAQDAAGNGNTAASQFSITYQQPLVANAQAVTVNLDANGNGTLQANSGTTGVNNNSTGSGTLNYTIQKITFGYIPEGTTPLTLTTPNGANFTQIRFASYGTPTNNGNGNYSLGSCNAANSLAAAQNAYVGRSSGSLYASNTDTRNNPVLGDPCGGTPKALAVQAGYSADAASLTYNCTEAGKTQYVLLTVTNGTSTSTSVAQVTVNAPPTATISSVSPTAAQRGATVTVAGTNLSGVSSVTVNGAAATVSNLTSTDFTFVVPGTATFGPGSISVATPCAQTLTNTFSVTAPALTATVSTTSASPTSTAPIPFSVTFSQSVGTTFTASDVTVANGTVTSGSFSGSGAGPYTFTVTPNVLGPVSVSVAASVAQDANNTQNSASNTQTVQFVAPTIVVAPNTLLGGTRGTAYSQTFTASGGTAPYTYAITAGALPSGLTLSSAGVLAGTPAVSGSFTFTVTATDASSAPGPYNGARSYTLTIAGPAITLAPATLPAGTVAAAYSQALSASGGTAPYTYAITAGALPAGLTLSSAGVLSGTPTAGGTFNFMVTATDASTSASGGPYSGALSYTLTITAPTITVAPAALPGGTQAVAYSQALSASGGTAPYTYAITAGALPAGLSLSSSGTIAGTPTVNGPFTFTVTATDASTGSGPYTGTRNYTLSIAAPTITIAPTTLPGGTQGTAYSQTLTASGGTAPYTYAITNGALPAGLSLTNGTLTGTPTANGTFNFTVTATDAFNSTGSQSYSLAIAVPAVTVVTWTGSVSTDWFTANNWTPNTVPNTTISAIIPTTPTGGRFPAISAGTAQARNFTLNSGASLTQSGGTLLVAGDLTNNGTFQPTGGTVTLGNSTLSNLFGSSNTRFWNLTVGTNGAQQSTSASTSVQRLLLLNGNFATNGNPFTLNSTPTLTAQVTNNGSNVVTGNVTVQRYIDPSFNPNLGYRHISTAVSGQTVSSLTTGSFSLVVNPAYNTSAQPGTTTPFPTVYGYDQSRLATATNNLSTFDKGWFSPNATSDALNVGQGYTALINGNQTWAFTGPLNNGILPLTLARNTGATANESGLSLVGNPYPSPLDWRQVVSNGGLSNVDASLYVFQSNDPTNPYTGQYGFYANGVGTTSPILAQGQGFFVRVTQGQTSGTLTFANNQRPTTYTATNYARTAAETRPLVQLSLKAAGSATGDDTFVYFEQGSTEGFDAQYDARKLPNPSGLNLSTTVGSEQFSIDGRPAIGTVQRVIPLAVGVPAAGAYSLSSAQLLNLATTPVYLRDKQTGALVDLAQQPSYQFTVSNAAALLTSRFELVFSPQQPLATVPAALVQQVGLYPNPAKKAAFVELPASLGRQAVTATLVDALGRVVRTVTLPAQGTQAHQLDLQQLPIGVYALRLTTSAGTIVKRLTVE